MEKYFNVSDKFVLTWELIPGHCLHLQSDALPMRRSNSQMLYQSDCLHLTDLSYNFSNFLKHESEENSQIRNI